MRLITSKDILGQMARWAVIQHPFYEPVGLFEICKLIDEAAQKQFENSVPGLPMRRFKDSHEIRGWLQATVGNHPTLIAWNTPRSGHTSNISVSRYDGPAPEDDFIDLDALLINVSREAWKDAEDFDDAKRVVQPLGTLDEKSAVPSAIHWLT
ncbi:MAG TPA: hypothetical protein VLJ17_15200 [Xanthobacteraceae bacterium]|nr:hypothetical protein [Xanthobacteraceae bacterium]